MSNVRSSTLHKWKPRNSGFRCMINKAFQEKIKFWNILLEQAVSVSAYVTNVFIVCVIRDYFATEQCNVLAWGNAADYN